MYAIIETGGKQYKAVKGEVIDIERLKSLPGAEVVFNNVLLAVQEDTIQIGQPYINNAKITAEVVRDFKAKKVITFKYRRRKSSKTTKGHRQQLTRVKIKEIKL